MVCLSNFSGRKQKPTQKRVHWNWALLSCSTTSLPPSQCVLHLFRLFLNHTPNTKRNQSGTPTNLIRNILAAVFCSSCDSRPRHGMQNELRIAKKTDKIQFFKQQTGVIFHLYSLYNMNCADGQPQLASLKGPGSSCDISSKPFSELK